LRIETARPLRSAGVTPNALVYVRVVSGFTARLTGVRPDQWANPSPCSAWTVRELVAHTVGTHRKVLGALGEGDVVEVDASGDLVQQWLEATHALGAALGNPDRAGQAVRGVEGMLPFCNLVGGLISPDTLAHTWDLARATGQDERLDERCVTACTQQLPEFGETLLRLGGFSAVPSAADADAQTIFLNAVGRQT
jgi:uncharacterized protein (TIGR03086 family)